MATFPIHLTKHSFNLRFCWKQPYRDSPLGRGREGAESITDFRSQVISKSWLLYWRYGQTSCVTSQGPTTYVANSAILSYIRWHLWSGISMWAVSGCSSRSWFVSGRKYPPYVHEGWFGQGDYGLGRLAEFLPQGSTDKTSKTFAILYWLSVTVTCYNNFFSDRCPFLFITNIAEIKLTGSKSYQQLIRHLSICMLPRYHSKLYLHKFVFHSYFSKVVYVLSFEVFPWFKKKKVIKEWLCCHLQ